MLELRPKGARDLLRMQRGALLRSFLPAQGLGEPPPGLLQGEDAPAAIRHSRHDGEPPAGPWRAGRHRQVQEVTHEENS